MHESGEYELVMHRHLDEANDNQMIMTSTHRDLSTMVETVATSWFTKQEGSSLGALPIPDPSVIVDDMGGDEDSEEEDDDKFIPDNSDDEADGDDDNDDRPNRQESSTNRASLSAAVISKRVDFSGVYKRTNAVNFEAFVGAQGAGYVQRKLASSMQLTHIITMDGPPFFSKIRLQEKGKLKSAQLCSSVMYCWRCIEYVALSAYRWPA